MVEAPVLRPPLPVLAMTSMNDRRAPVVIVTGGILFHSIFQFAEVFEGIFVAPPLLDARSSRKHADVPAKKLQAPNCCGELPVSHCHQYVSPQITQHPQLIDTDPGSQAQRLALLLLSADFGDTPSNVLLALQAAGIGARGRKARLLIGSVRAFSGSQCLCESFMPGVSQYGHGTPALWNVLPYSGG